MVTPDELDPVFRNLNGKLHLRMTCHVNDKYMHPDENTNDLYHPFTKIILK